MDLKQLGACLDAVRTSAPLVHCITNYVTVNDCANAVLAVGASPIMSDEPEDVEDITSICDGLDLNIGTLNQRSIDAMDTAAMRAGELHHKIVLDPVGAGASNLRTQTAKTLLELRHPTLVRGNMSEIKALSGAAGSTRGVDVAPSDATNQKNLAQAASFVRGLSRSWGCVVAVTGAIDLVSDGNRTLAIRNGDPIMGRITGTGCMLSAISPAFLAAGADDLVAATTAVCSMGVCGQLARSRMSGLDGTGSFRTYIIDALYNLTADQLVSMAQVEEL